MTDREVRVGEIVAWRYWRVVGGIWRGPLTIWSSAVPMDWTPGRPMTGYPARLPRLFMTTAYGEGIHAYENREEAWLNAVKSDHSFLVIGTVWLWGHIILHERGYRAEFAYPRSFDGVRFPGLRFKWIKRRVFGRLDATYLGANSPMTALKEDQ